MQRAGSNPKSSSCSYFHARSTFHDFDTCEQGTPVKIVPSHHDHKGFLIKLLKRYLYTTSSIRQRAVLNDLFLSQARETATTQRSRSHHTTHSNYPPPLLLSFQSVLFIMCVFCKERSPEKKQLFFWILSKLPRPPPMIWTTCTTFFEHQCAKKFGQGSPPPSPSPNRPNI